MTQQSGGENKKLLMLWLKVSSRPIYELKSVLFFAIKNCI